MSTIGAGLAWTVIYGVFFAILHISSEVKVIHTFGVILPEKCDCCSKNRKPANEQVTYFFMDYLVFIGYSYHVVFQGLRWESFNR